MARNKRILLVLLALVFLLGGCKMWLPWGKNTDMARSTPEGLYQQGLEEYKDGSYKKSVELFQRVKEEYPLSPLAIMAEIGIADSFFSGKEYPEAGLAYREFLNLHPTNENLPYVMYQIGMSYYSQMTTIDRDQSEAFKALKEFERLIARFPDSKFAVMAAKTVKDCKKSMGEKEFYVGEFYFKIKEYRAALKRFEKIEREYANVGLDDRVSRFIGETKKRIAMKEAKTRPVEKK